MNVKDKVMMAAEKLFADRGFDGVSVRDITAAAGVNLGAVTYHFGTKEKLLGDVLLRKLEPMKRLGVSIMVSRNNPVKKLTALMDLYATHLLFTDPTLKVLFAELLTGGRRIPREVKDSMLLRNRMFIQVVKEGVKSGDFRKCDLECAAWNFYGMMAAYILYEPVASGDSRQRAFPLSYVKRIAAAAVDIFLNGIVARRPRTK